VTNSLLDDIGVILLLMRIIETSDPTNPSNSVIFDESEQKNKKSIFADQEKS
jgi:hypothetical protein